MKYLILSGDIAVYITILMVLFVITIFIFLVLYFSHVSYKHKKELQINDLKKDYDRLHDNNILLLKNMSREIRNNMIYVMGMSELILRESGDETVRDNASFIRSSGSDILSILQGTLDYSNIENGLTEIVNDEFDMSSLVIDTVSICGPLLKYKGMDLDIHIDRSTPKMVTGDFKKLRRVLLYILSFIRKNSEKEKVSFTLESEKTGDDKVTVSYEIKTKKFSTSLDDIKSVVDKDPSKNKKLFSQYDYDFLEIMLAGSILRALGSALKISETDSKEVIFSFSVKHDVTSWDGIGDIRAVGNSRTNAESVGKFRASGARILVADTNNSGVDIIRRFISKSGVRVDEAYSVDEIIAHVAGHEYDVLFMDESFRDDEGRKIVDKIREGNINILNAHKPCICFTGDIDKKISDNPEDSGYDAYLTKPVNPASFEDCLIKYLPEQKTELVDVSTRCPGILGSEDIRRYSEGYDELYQNALNIYKRAKSYR